jgi:GNAT superfamily N-acetyltransferase
MHRLGTGPEPMWVYDDAAVDWDDELSELYRIAPLGDKPPEHLRTVFSNSMFTCFVYVDGRLVAAGRILADGLDCAYLADVAIYPDHQRRGLGSAVINELVRLAGATRRSSCTPTPAQRACTPGWASCR